MRVPRVVRFGRGDLNRTPLLKVVGPDGSDPSQPISIDGKSQEVAFTVLATADWTADIAGDEGLRPLRPQRRDGQHQGDCRSGPQPQRRDPLGYRVVPSRRRGALRLHDLPDRGATLSRRRSAAISIVGDRTEFTVAVSTNQSPWKVEIDSPDGDGWLTQQSKERLDHLPGRREHDGQEPHGDAQIRLGLHPEVFNYVTVTQGYVVPAPTADLLDVVFAEDGNREGCLGHGHDRRTASRPDPVDRLPRKIRPVRRTLHARTERSFGRAGKRILQGGVQRQRRLQNKLEDGYAMEVLLRPLRRSPKIADQTFRFERRRRRQHLFLGRRLEPDRHGDGHEECHGRQRVENRQERRHPIEGCLLPHRRRMGQGRRHAENLCRRRG